MKRLREQIYYPRAKPKKSILLVLALQYKKFPAGKKTVQMQHLSNCAAHFLFVQHVLLSESVISHKKFPKGKGRRQVVDAGWDLFEMFVLELILHHNTQFYYAYMHSTFTNLTLFPNDQTRRKRKPLYVDKRARF